MCCEITGALGYGDTHILPYCDARNVCIIGLHALGVVVTSMAHGSIWCTYCQATTVVEACGAITKLGSFVYNLTGFGTTHLVKQTSQKYKTPGQQLALHLVIQPSRALPGQMQDGCSQQTVSPPLLCCHAQPNQSQIQGYLVRTTEY